MWTTLFASSAVGRMGFITHSIFELIVEQSGELGLVWRLEEDKRFSWVYELLCLLRIPLEAGEESGKDNIGVDSVSQRVHDAHDPA